MKKRAFSFVCISLILTGLLAGGCFPSISSATQASNTTEIPPLPAPRLLSPAPTEGVFVLPSPVSTSFPVDHATVELKEYVLDLTTQDLADPERLASIYAVLNSDRWQPARQSGDGILVDEKKQILNAWGFRCENNGLYKDGKLLVQSLACNEGDATFNRSRTNFVWFLPVENRERGWMVSRYSLDQTWHQRNHFWVLPKYMGDDLLVVSGFSGEKGPEVRVERNGQTVFDQTLHGTGDCLGTGLQVWEEAHWGLNTEGDVIVDGKLVRQTQGYSGAFGLRVLRGKPVYFVEQEQEIKLIFDGQAMPLHYDHVIHTCYPVYQEVFYHLDIGVLPEFLWFFAREGDVWYYVEMGIHE